MSRISLTSRSGAQRTRHTLAHSVVIGIVCMALAGFLVLNGDGHVARAMSATASCNVKSFGALGDGSQKDTTAIQSAIDACANQGGGVVEFPTGAYLSAPLFLQSGVTLQVDTGATLLASQDPADYVIPPGVTVATPILAFINAYGINNIGITGGGVIDGNGAPWWASGKTTSQRPRLIELAHVNNITVRRITLQNAASMHLFLSFTTNVLVTHITITAPANSPNTDGIDPASSHNVTIDHCLIDTGDDNIAIKSGAVEADHPNAGTSDITVEHCQFLHGHGVSIGSETNGGVKNVLVDDSTFQGTTNGIRIKSSRTNGGDVGNVLYRHLTMTGVTNPIIFAGYYPKIPVTDPPQPITATTPYYHDITVDDFVSTGSPDAGDIVGVPEAPLTNITLHHVQITATVGLVVRNATVTASDTTITVATGTPYIIQENGYVINA